MTSFKQHLYELFGRVWGDDDLVVIFSVRLDETGTDGKSPYVVVGGAVATVDQWDKLEVAWGLLLTRSKVAAYHWKEFNDRKGDFAGWKNLKCKRFVRAQEKIIKNNTLFRVSVGLEDAVHADIKERMKGIKGFHSDSSYSLCLRALMFQTCEQLAKHYPDCRLSVLVEDGPWASGAMVTYQHVAAMTGERKPAKHAHRLAGLTSVPKGERLSLEAADYLAGEEHARLLAGKRPRRGAQTLSTLLTASYLERWYRGMLKEKEARRTYGRRKSKKAPSSLVGQPS